MRYGCHRLCKRRNTVIAFSCALILWSASDAEAQRSPGSTGFEVTEATIASTQMAIKSGQTTCRAIAEAYLARVAAYDQRPQPGRLNSIVLLNPQLLQDADSCDRSFGVTHALLPLSGIVVVVKDNYDTAGLQTTGGSLALKGFVPRRDATMVARLKAAGALILGKSNMAEWAFSPYVTVSSIDGITRNPYDLSRVPAGSSGGTAAAVAAHPTNHRAYEPCRHYSTVREQRRWWSYGAHRG